MSVVVVVVGGGGGSEMPVSNLHWIPQVKML